MSRSAVRVRSSALLSTLSPRWSSSWDGSSEKDGLATVGRVAPTVDREKSPIGGGSKAPSTLSLKYLKQALITHGVASLQLLCKLLYAKASITS